MAVRRLWPGPGADTGFGGSRFGNGARRSPGFVRGAIERSALRTDLDRGLVRPIAAARVNWLISVRPRRYESTDSEPLFSLGRSECNPSEQLPVSGSISVVLRSL